MSPRVLLESSRGQFWENCRNQVRGRFWRNRQTFPRDVSGTPAKPDVATCPTSHQNTLRLGRRRRIPAVGFSRATNKLHAVPPWRQEWITTRPFSTARSSGRASNATARSLASAWSSNSLPWQRRRMVHRHMPHSCPNHLAATAPSLYLHTTDEELAQSPLSRVYTQLVHSTCWQSLITPRRRPPLLLKWFLLPV